MDDNELDKLFGFDGDPDSSGSDDPEHLQIVDSKDKKPGTNEPAEKASGKKEAAPEGDKKPDGKEEKSGSSEEEDKPAKEEETEEKKESEDSKTAEDGSEEKSGEEKSEEDKEGSGKPSEKKHSEDKEKAPSKPKKRKFRITGFGISVIVFAVLLITMLMLLLFLPAFRVRSVTIEGNVEMTDEEVLKEVGLKYNAHLMSGVSGNLIDILSLNYGKTEERIRQNNAYISDITISIRIPSEVRITVKERRKIAYVSTPDGYIALDRYGTVLELNSGKLKQKVSPIVYGITVESAKLGEKVVVIDENSYKKAILVLGAILNADNATIGDRFNMFEHTKEVRILPSGYIFLTIYTESGKPVQVKLNKTDKINDKMTQLLFLFNSNAFDQITIKGTLDMTNDEYIFNPSK